MHEPVRDFRPSSAGSSRFFGLVMSGASGAVGFIPTIHGASPRWTFVVAAAILLVIAIARPHLLEPLNHMWFRLSIILGRITTPIIMGLLFVVVVTPMAFFLRLLGKDLLGLLPDRSVQSYWTPRDPLDADSMRHLF